MRQLRFSEQDEQSLDLALFLNGIPIFTVELKSPLNGQDVQDGIRQYREDRDPREPLFGYARCLAHFAVDPEQVFVTTSLAGPKTRFLPFNRGRFGGAGNPPVPPTRAGFPTDYLWEEVWARDSVLDLVRQFIHEVETEDDGGRKTGKRYLMFPRSQQLDCVRRLVRHARDHGAGERYLVQHSAGSGKSFTIAWLAHQLSVLHDRDDRCVFDSVVVVTDRRVLDRQLQRSIRQFEQTLGVVENIDHTSRQLREALEAGRTIIVTTLQKFPVHEKVAVCVEHFAAQVAAAIDGRAKAMVVTRSRLHAVRTRLALDAYLAEKGHPWKALVAFSGTVKDGGDAYTESGMNSAGQDRVIGERQTASEFEKPEYRFLVVASKFQTGFDQPLLHTMYVDKKSLSAGSRRRRCRAKTWSFSRAPPRPGRPQRPRRPRRHVHRPDHADRRRKDGLPRELPAEPRAGVPAVERPGEVDGG